MLRKIWRKFYIQIDRIRMGYEYFCDYKEYKRWNYNNPRVHTIEAEEAKILRQTHVLEKGMSLSNPRRGFGQEKIDTLFSMLNEYIKLGYDTKNIPFQNAISVLGQYETKQKEMGYENPELFKRIHTYDKFLIDDIQTGIIHISYSELEKSIHDEFPNFFLSRHSLRQFSPKTICVEDLEKAIRLAQKAPTACNRQASKVYYYSDPEKNKRIGELIPGNTGFSEEVQNYLVITADMSAFFNTFERNQVYVEAGLFTMALLEALHYYGIASCALQNGEYRKRNREFKKICGNIPENEKIVIFIAVGYYKDDFNYAVSKRKNLEEIFRKD